MGSLLYNCHTSPLNSRPQVLIAHTNSLTHLIPKSCSLLSLITVKVICRGYCKSAFKFHSFIKQVFSPSLRKCIKTVVLKLFSVRGLEVVA